MNIENFSANEQKYIKGDTCLVISPYDSFQLFTIYKDNTSNKPVNLTNTGTLYLNFIGSSGDVIIPNYTEADNIDIVNGQVLFKISKEDARTILSLDDNNFYITAKKKIGDGYTEDETVLYQGQWSSYTDATQSSISAIVNELSARILELEESVKNLTDTNNQLTNQITSLENTVADRNKTINSLNAELSKYASIETANYVDISSADVDSMTEDELQKLLVSLGKNY